MPLDAINNLFIPIAFTLTGMGMFMLLKHATGDKRALDNRQPDMVRFTIKHDALQ